MTSDGAGSNAQTIVWGKVSGRFMKKEKGNRGKTSGTYPAQSASGARVSRVEVREGTRGAGKDWRPSPESRLKRTGPPLKNGKANKRVEIRAQKVKNVKVVDRVDLLSRSETSGGEKDEKKTTKAGRKEARS